MSVLGLFINHVIFFKEFANPHHLCMIIHHLMEYPLPTRVFLKFKSFDFAQGKLGNQVSYNEKAKSKVSDL